MSDIDALLNPAAINHVIINKKFAAAYNPLNIYTSDLVTNDCL